MAKKVVATLKKGESKSFAKVVKPVKNEVTGAYSFREEMIPLDQVKDYFKKD